MLFIASPLLGYLSDRFGRRPVLLIALCGAGFDYLLMAFAPNLTILFIGRIISGLTGASMTVAASYIADVSDDSNRTSNFGMIGAAFGVGFVIGPALGGLVGSFGHIWPFAAFRKKKNHHRLLKT
jgi:DHA1 family tetracycline resistance protein-like MFS transporter